MSTYSQSEDALVRRCISRSIKKCRKSRKQIAEDMTRLLETRVTLQMLYSYSAEMKQFHRLPTQWAIAFCRAVDDFTLLQELALRAGFRMIGPAEERLIETGKAYTEKLRAEAILRRVEL